MMRVDAFARSLSAPHPRNVPISPCRRSGGPARASGSGRIAVPSKARVIPAAISCTPICTGRKATSPMPVTGMGGSGDRFQPWLCPRNGTPSSPSCSHRASAKRMYSRERRWVAPVVAPLNPIRLLCRLRRGCHPPRRTTRYAAGATPYSDRTFTPAGSREVPDTPYLDPSPFWETRTHSMWMVRKEVEES